MWEIITFYLTNSEMNLPRKIAKKRAGRFKVRILYRIWRIDDDDDDDDDDNDDDDNNNEIKWKSYKPNIDEGTV